MELPACFSYLGGSRKRGHTFYTYLYIYIHSHVWGFPKTRGTCSGDPRNKTVVFGGYNRLPPV